MCHLDQVLKIVVDRVGNYEKKMFKTISMRTSVNRLKTAFRDMEDLFRGLLNSKTSLYLDPANSFSVSLNLL